MPLPKNKAHIPAPRLACFLPAFALALTVFGGCPLVPGSGNGNSNAPAGNLAPLILNFDVTPTSVNVGEPVTISWEVADQNGDKLSAAISVDREQRTDYEIADAGTTRTQIHTFLNAGTMPVRLRVSDGYLSTEMAISVSVGGPISIDIYDPYGGRTVFEDSIRVCATIRSEFEIESVSTKVGDRSAALELTKRGTGFAQYCGSIDVSDVPSGLHLVTVGVRDVQDNEAEAPRGIVVNRLPQSELLEPLDEGVVGATARVHIRCTDPDSGQCAGHAAIRSGFPQVNIDLGDFVDELDKAADVSALPGAALFVWTSGTGELSRLPPVFYVEPSTRLHQLQQAGGRILDADAGRILYATGIATRRTLDVPSDWVELSVLDRVTGATVAVPVPTNARFSEGDARLVDGGVAYRVTPSGGTGRPRYWWNGTTQVELTRAIGSVISVAGPYIAWTEQNVITLFDTTTGGSEVVSSNATRFDFDQHGTVVFVEKDTYALKRYRAGVTTTLYQDDAKSVSTPILDGENTLVRVSNRVGGAETRLLLIDAAGMATEIAAGTAESPIGDVYAMSAGWIAFQRTGPGGAAQVWRRRLNGEAEQVTFFSDSSKVEGIDASGGIMLIRGNQPNWRRYFSAVDQGLIEVSHAHGAAKLIDGKWNLLLGRVLFDVVTE